MIYYGGCSVKFSNYTLTDNNLSGIFTQNATKNSCLEPNLDDSVLPSFFSSVKYINYNIISNIAYITFYDADYSHLSTFQNQSPPYPSTWP